MGPVHDVDRHLRVEPGELCHRLVELLAAVAAQIPDAQPELIVLADADGLPPDRIHLLQHPSALGVKVFPRRGEGKAAVLPVDQLHPQLLFQRPYLLGDG